MLLVIAAAIILLLVPVFRKPSAKRPVLTTFADLHARGACLEGYKKAKRFMDRINGGHIDSSKPFPLVLLLKSNPVEDVMWGICATGMTRYDIMAMLYDMIHAAGGNEALLRRMGVYLAYPCWATKEWIRMAPIRTDAGTLVYALTLWSPQDWALNWGASTFVALCAGNSAKMDTLKSIMAAHLQ